MRAGNRRGGPPYPSLPRRRHARRRSGRTPRDTAYRLVRGAQAPSRWIRSYVPSTRVSAARERSSGVGSGRHQSLWAEHGWDFSCRISPATSWPKPGALAHRSRGQPGTTGPTRCPVAVVVLGIAALVHTSAQFDMAQIVYRRAAERPRDDTMHPTSHRALGTASGIG